MDSLSLTLTIGPVILKAATLAKQCHDIQARLSAPPDSLLAVAEECTEIHRFLESFQDLGRQESSQIGAEATKNINHGIGAVRKSYSKVLASFEEHVEILEESIETRVDGDTHPALRDQDDSWKEEEVYKLINESKQQRETFDSLLEDLQISIQPKASHIQGQDDQIPKIPTIEEPPIPQDPQPSTSRFSIDSTATHDFAINPSRFSADSISSTLSATPFDFDTEALSSPSYRQAFSERVRSLISRPLNSPGDAALLRAVEPLEGEEHYYEQSVEIEWDPSISGSTIRSDGTGSSRSSLRTLDSQVTFSGSLATKSQRIGHPVNPVHVSHIGFDPVTGDFTGLPAEWRKILLAEDERARAAAASSAGQPSSGLNPSSGSARSKKSTTIKLVVVGDSGRLKQCLLITYVTNKYPSEYVPQVFDNYAVTIMVGDEPYTLGIFDTTGQESYDRLRPLSYPLTDVFMIIISTSTPSNYTSARDTWAPELKHHCPGVPFLLVGIQDPPDAAVDTASKKKARVDKGRKLAGEIGAEKYVECELESGRGVKNVFDEAIVAALEPVVVPKKRRRSKLRLLSRIEED
ncbi:hypothetical protein IFR05_013626 [Cadophora sp. M221]|nr:hypothetical protein IFR05_013626 [Cadophora sp. M221]